MRKNSPYSNTISYKRRLYFGLVILLILMTTVSWSLVTSDAQEGPAQLPQAGRDKVIVKADSGSVLSPSAESPNAATASNLKRLLQNYPGTWKADIVRGYVKNLKPSGPVAVEASPKDFTRKWLAQFSSLFGVGSEATGYLTEFNLGPGRIVEYRQVFGGVPVEYSFLTFSVKDSKLEQITSRVYPQVGRGLSGTTPALDKKTAFDLALLDLGSAERDVSRLRINFKGELVVLPEAEADFLAWKLTLSAEHTLLSYTYYVDALTGIVVKKYSNVRSQTETNSPRQGAGLSTTQETSAVLKNRTGRVVRPDKDKKSGVDGSAAPIGPPQPLSTWETILSENFDVLNFPYSPWYAFDNNGSTGGELYWDDQPCVSNDPSWSLWAADAGANALNACTDNYANNMDSWVVYGPFDLSGSTDGLLEFHYNNVSESNYDHFKWVASVNGTNFSGYQVSGDSGGWRYASLDFKNVPTLGNITGRSQVWIAFIFTSDSSVVSGKGAFVDDVAIKRFRSSTCSGVSGHVGGHIYGRNRNELVLRNFKNAKVVLDKSFAFDSHAVTNSSGNYSSSDCSDYVRFELEGYGTNNFVRAVDCNDGTCAGNTEVLRSQSFVFSSVVNFDWNVDAENKKEVNVFWHTNEMHDWFKNLLGQDLMNYQMQAYVDFLDPDREICPAGYPQAFYYPADQNMYFCPADGSKESDVIYHEYTHGVVDHIPNYVLPYVDESGAIDEGVADYYAAAKNGDPVIGELLPDINRSITSPISYSDKCTREGGICRPDQYWLRSTGPDQQTNDNGYVHHNSIVPSGALWNLRQSQGLSPSYVDQLVLDTLIFHRPTSFTELLNGLISQDGGSHESQIRAAFATRGVTSGIAIGEGAPNPTLFIQAADRNNLTLYVNLPPINAVHRWNCSTCDASNPSRGKGLIQDFNGNDGVSHDALMMADTNTSFVALIYGGMWTKFIALGGVSYNSANNRQLGYPIADRNCSDYNAQCFTDASLVSPFGTSYHYQRFQGGALVLHRSGSRNGQTYETHGAIRTKWQSLGGPGSGSYGLPISDEYSWSGKRRSDFEGGSICFNPATNLTELGCTTTSAPGVTTGVATSVVGTSATLNGTVNPRGAATNGWFEWGTSSTLSTYNTTAAQSIGSGSVGVALAKAVGGLSPNTTYYFRAAGSNSSGTTRGSILSFRTASLPSLRVNNVTVTEANTGANTTATFTVSLSAASSQTVTVKYQTANGSAAATADYTALALTTLTFTPGQTTKTVGVIVRGDALDETNETFRLLLSSPTNATIAAATGTCTITDNDPPPNILISNAVVTEPDSGVVYATFNVRLSAPSGRPVSVKYVTANGTAAAGPDYTAVPLTTLTFQPGQTLRTVRVAIVGDTGRESNETFFVNLSGAVNAVITDAQGQGTIMNDD